ncbi:uncharacterized protein LOC118438924 [Folsomia candida]|uniref:uncharacterized protein LOC118438924 n=1 Tax=Folsomia candida TaxID=158441 RepID=UPI0016055A13|nr:uncharacterized protein LOC118438924 [Folsomia candida]
MKAPPPPPRQGSPSRLGKGWSKPKQKVIHREHIHKIHTHVHHIHKHNLYKHTIHKHNQHKHILNIVKAPEQIVHSYNQEVVKVVPTEERSSRRSPSTTSSTKFLPRRNKQPHRLSTMDTSIRIMTGRYKPPWLEGVGPRGGRVCGVEQLNM